MSADWADAKFVFIGDAGPDTKASNRPTLTAVPEPVAAVTFKIPANADEACKVAQQLGEWATAAQWGRCALVFALVRVGRHGGDRSKVKVDLDADSKMSAAEFAGLNIHGLTSPTSVRRCWAVWDRAVADGLAVAVSLGDEIVLPDVDWADYTAADDGPDHVDDDDDVDGGDDVDDDGDDGGDDGPAPERSYEYYTPKDVAAARQRMGPIDLDPASCDKANETIQAVQYFTEEQDGLTLPWHGRVWLNPPFGKWGAWAPKVLEECGSGRVVDVCVVLPTRTLTAQYAAPLVLAADLLWTPYGRLQFGGGGSSADDGHGVLYMGPHTEDFRREFSALKTNGGVGRVWS